MSPASALSHLTEQQKRSKTLVPAAEEERDPRQAPDTAATWLQQTLGNQALGSLGQSPVTSVVQPRSVLQRLVAGPSRTNTSNGADALQRAPEEEEEVQRKLAAPLLQRAPEEEEEVQRKPDSSTIQRVVKEGDLPTLKYSELLPQAQDAINRIFNGPYPVWNDFATLPAWVTYLSPFQRQKYCQKWGSYFGNHQGLLPGYPHAGGYREYYVQPNNGNYPPWGSLRILVKNDGSKTYYTWTHYGDNGNPAFVEVLY